MVSQNSEGTYSIPEWAAVMTEAEFKTEYDVDTLHWQATLECQLAWNSVIRVRDRQHGLRCTLFSTLDLGEIIELTGEGNAR